MKTKSQELQLIREDLQKIFLNDYRGVNARIVRELAKIDIEVYGNKHPKIRVKNKVITLTSTSGTIQTGRAILREIRRIYEMEEEK